MKVQFQSNAMRLRISEAELTELLAGRPLSLRCEHAGRPLFALQVQLADALHLQSDEHWRLSLPATAVRDYTSTLPRRDALVFDIGDEHAAAGAESVLRVDLEVDVRDSLQWRGPRPR